jgi:hypothetical protein
MTDHDPNRPFERDIAIDQPGLIGARWWHKGLVDETAVLNRRAALATLAMTGAAIVGIGAIGAGIAALTGDDYLYQTRRSLEMQRTYGWNFGARNQNLVFDGYNQLPFDRAALDTLEPSLRPDRHLAFHIPTLLQAPNALPTAQPGEETVPFVPLKTALQPVFTGPMQTAFNAGAGLANLFADKSLQAGVLVDLDGSESIAFAAGAAREFEPVFLFDNWPHPWGIVPSHRTLGAVVYYQPLFVQRKAERRANAPPMFLLDRQRLSIYRDESWQFDNRYLARIPSASALISAGIERLLYVVPTAVSLPELDDLNQPLVDLVSGGVEVRALNIDAFSTFGTDTHYGGTPTSHAGFWQDYPWWQASEGTSLAYSRANARVRAYRPVRRYTSLSGNARTTSEIGFVKVVLATGSGAVLGASFDRRGSWNRISTSGGG